MRIIFSNIKSNYLKQNVLNNRILLILITLLICGHDKYYSQVPVPVNVENTGLCYPLHKHTKYLRVLKNDSVDPNIVKKLNDFKHFELSELEIDNEGKNDYWFLFSVKSNIYPLYLTLPNVQYYHLDLFNLVDGKLLPLSRGGIGLPASQKYLNISKEIFLLPKRSSDTSVYLLRANRLTFKSFGAEIYPKEALISSHYRVDFFEGILMGIIICVILHNLLMYFNSREKVYGFLTIYMFFLLLQVSTYSGHFNAFISFESAKWNEVCYNLIPSLSAFYSFRFSHYFLDLKIMSQKWVRKIYLAFIWTFIISGISSIFSIPVLNQLTILTSGFAVIFLLTVGIIRYKNNFKPAITYLNAYLPSFISVPYLLYYTMGNLEYNWFTHNNLLISIVSQAILFSLANAQKIKLLKEKNELLLLGEKEQLEKMVDLRTSELLLEKRNVEGQKRVIEEKQIEIIDSINYAKRIQYALLAHEDFLNLNIPNNFVYFNPKDIVSGDFYWATKKDNKFYLAVCDSTGHGVPGAFMSLLNIGFLSEAINEKDIEKPNEVFNYVRMRLIDSLGKEEHKDGFDGILICIDLVSKNITYTAANNKPILISNQQIIELKSDRMPVGKGEKKENFNLYSLNYSPGDYLYLYTDGYADQFGGLKGKKFKYKPLNELLLLNHLKPDREQKNILVNKFNEWRNNLEQVDDILIIGIKL
jgi:serine phosphatase RsbU (regulator of sigma subunit)